MPCVFGGIKISFWGRKRQRQHVNAGNKVLPFAKIFYQLKNSAIDRMWTDKPALAYGNIPV